MLLQTLQYDNRIFGLDAQLLFTVFFQMAAIFLLFLAVSYFLFDPVRKLLNDRRARVLGEQENAQKNRREAEKLREQYEKKLARADREVEKILGGARKKASEREKEIVEGARMEASRIVREADRDAELERSRVQEAVRREIISTAAVMSEKIMGASVDERLQEILFAQTVEELEEGKSV